MTVSSTQIRVTYTGDGASTNFTVPFPFYLSTDLMVILGGATLGSGYGVTGGEDTTGAPNPGTVIMAVAPGIGVSLQIILNVPLTQLVNLVDGTAFPSATLDQVHDRSVQGELRLQDQISRSIRAPDGDVAPAMLLPVAAQRALTFPTFDASGNLSVAQTLPAGTLSQATIGQFLWPRTSAEIAASVTPVNYAYQPGNVLRYGAIADSTTDCTTAFQNAVNVAITAAGQYCVMIPEVSGQFYKVSNTIWCVNQITFAGVGGLQILGVGLPTIQSTLLTAPIFAVGGERFEMSGLRLQYASLPTNAQTNAVCVRVYNLYESRIHRMYFNNCFGAIDQYQGLVNSGPNAFYSNHCYDWRIVQWSGYCARLIPFSGGNSGNTWENIYTSNATGGTIFTSNTVCLGGVWLQTCQDDVWIKLNIESTKCSGSLIVLNQAGNPTFLGTHFESNYGQSSNQPYIDILGGDGSAPIFEGITLSGNSFAAQTGQSLFRMDGNGTRLVVEGVISANNTTPANCNAILAGGSTAYGSFCEFNAVNDLDGALSQSVFNPKVSLGTPTTQGIYPVQRWNQNIPKMSALITATAVGTSGNNVGSASVPVSIANAFNDYFGLWDATNQRFDIKQQGNYLVTVSVPSASVVPTYLVSKNGTVMFTGVAPSTSGAYSVNVSCTIGDYIQVFFNSGTITNTNGLPTFCVSLAS